MLRLEFGLNRSIPATAKVAWGARMIVEKNGSLDLVPDRQSAAGTQEDRTAFLLKCNEANVIKGIREAWSKLYRPGIERSELDYVLYDKNGLKCIGSPNASHGYLYVCVFEVE